MFPHNGGGGHPLHTVCSVMPRMEEVVVKHPNLEIIPPIGAKIVGEKHKLVFLVVVICYLVVVNWL